MNAASDMTLNQPFCGLLPCSRKRGAKLVILVIICVLIMQYLVHILIFLSYVSIVRGGTSKHGQCENKSHINLSTLPERKVSKSIKRRNSYPT